MECSFPKEIKVFSLPSLSICDLVALKYKKKVLITGVGPKKETNCQPKMRCKCSLGTSLSQGFTSYKGSKKSFLSLLVCITGIPMDPAEIQFLILKTDLLYLKLLDSLIRFAEIPLSHLAKHCYQDFCDYRKLSKAH